MQSMRQVAMKIKLADARAELRVSQTALAKAAGLSKQVIVNAEKGLVIQRISAHAILRALNEERNKQGFEPLTIDSLSWSIQGSGDNWASEGQGKT